MRQQSDSERAYRAGYVQALRDCQRSVSRPPHISVEKLTEPQIAMLRRADRGYRRECFVGRGQARTAEWLEAHGYGATYYRDAYRRKFEIGDKGRGLLAALK